MVRVHAPVAAPAPAPAKTRRRRPVRVGIVCDYVDEGWASMDLAAELLEMALRQHGEEFVPVLLRPPMPRIARRASGSRRALNADRYLGRYVAYPRWLRRHRGDCDLFHVVDQSYAHLVHSLPAERTVVTCHDLDVYRSLLGGDERPFWFRRTMRRVLSGMQRAARLVCDSEAVRQALAERRLVPPGRVSVAPLPVHPDFAPEPDAAGDAEAARLLGPARPGAIDLLHVGINVPRKGIDFLLRVFAEVRGRHPGVRLLRAGGPLTAEQRARAAELGIAGDVVELPFLQRPVLAAVYRRATGLLAPSEREGFGLPLVEAMACGTPVIASDLGVFREVGGEAAVYRDPYDAAAWVGAVDTLLHDRRNPREWRARREAALARAAEFGLEDYARAVCAVYRRLPRAGKP